MRAPSRRAALATIAGAAAALAAGCGFALKRPVRLPFASIALVGFAADSPLAAELRRQLSGQVRIAGVDTAQVVLHAIDETYDRNVVSTTAAAQVRELELRLTLRWRAATPQGRELIAPAELRVERELRYNETVALAKEYEQVELERDLRADIVAQVLRRLAAVSI